MTTLAAKKELLTWVLQNVSFKEREAYWLLNYIVTHETILAKTKIVEQVEATPRGIRFADISFDDFPPFELFKHQLTFRFAEQIFHEIRINPQFDLYLEFMLADGWKNDLLLAALENNPYHSWNDMEALEQSETDVILNQMETEFQQKELRQLIDEALETGDIARFKELSQYLKTT